MTLREEKELAISVKQKDSVREETDQCSFRHQSHDRSKPTPKAAPSSDPPTPRGGSASRKEASEVEASLGSPTDSRATTS